MLRTLPLATAIVLVASTVPALAQMNSSTTATKTVTKSSSSDANTSATHNATVRNKTVVKRHHVRRHHHPAHKVVQKTTMTTTDKTAQ